MPTCRLLLVRLASLTLLGALGVACGGSAAAPSPPAVANPGNTVTVASPKVSALRVPSTCGVTNPPFTSTDAFSLDIVLGPRTETPYNGLLLEYDGAVAVGKPIALTVEPFLAQGTQSGDGPWYAAQDAQSGSISFGYEQGADPSGFDQSAFDSVTLTFEAIPTEDGEPLTVRL